MKKKISLVVLLSMMFSLIQPTWAMNEEEQQNTPKRKREEKSEGRERAERATKKLKYQAEGNINKPNIPQNEDDINAALSKGLNQLKFAVGNLSSLIEQNPNALSCVSAFFDFPTLSAQLDWWFQETQTQSVTTVSAHTNKKPDDQEETHSTQESVSQEVIEGPNYFELLPVELTSLIISTYLSPRDALAFAGTSKYNLDVFYGGHPLFQELKNFLSERDYFAKENKLSRLGRILNF